MSCRIIPIPYNLNCQIAGDAVNSAFPALSRQATFSYPSRNLAIVGVSLSTTLVAAVSGGLNGLMVVLALNQGAASIAFSQDIGVLASHTAYRNTYVLGNFYNPANQCTHYFMPDDYGFLLPAGMSVSLYVATDNNSDSYISALATIYTLQAR